MVSKVIVGGGGNRWSVRKTDQGNALKGGDKRGRRETAVADCRKDMTGRVARHQAG